MASGFFLGGASQGFNQAREAGIQQQQTDQQGNYQTKILQLKQKEMENQQHRELFARSDKARTELMDTIKQTISAAQTQAALSGQPLDTDKLSKSLMPLAQMAAKNASLAGVPNGSDAVLAQFTSMLATARAATTNPQTAAMASKIKPGAAPLAAGDVPQQPVNVADAGGTPMPPGQNLADANTTSYRVDAGPVETNRPTPAAPAAPTGGNDVDRLTKVLMTLPATPEGANIREAVKLRLQDAISKSNTEATVHFAKTEDGGEIPLVIKKTGGNISITDTLGHPYVAPTGTEGGDRAKIADAIISGKQPPVLTGLYKNAKGVRAALADKGFDLSTAQQEWQAATKQITSLNGPQMVRYAGLAKSVVNTIDEVKDLSEKMELSGVPLANAAKIAAYMQTAGNSEGGQLAARYLGAVTTLKEEFANLAQGGYAPTEAAFALANKQINENYGVKQMNASLTEVQRLIRYRLNGIPNFSTAGPDAANRYKPGGNAAPANEPAKAPPPPPGFVISSPQ